MVKILAVDDSASMRQMVGFTLKKAGFDVTDATDGRDGLAKANKNQYDLILADINMPVMDGVELLKALRASEPYHFTPILLLTTESASEKKEEGQQAGATGWIVKPFNPDQLLKTISQFVA